LSLKLDHVEEAKFENDGRRNGMDSSNEDLGPTDMEDSDGDGGGMMRSWKMEMTYVPAWLPKRARPTTYN
jgi:hypothetical protein